MNTIIHINQLFDKDTFNIVQNYLVNYPIENMHRDNQSVGSFIKYGDAFTDALGMTLLPKIENIVNRKLYVSYSFFRKYQNLSELKPHRDRLACEYTVNICIKRYSSWDFNIQIYDNIKSYDLYENEAIIFDGINHIHWRDIIQSIPIDCYQIYLYIHYVRNPDLSFDKRPYLGAYRYENTTNNTILYIQKNLMLQNISDLFDKYLFCYPIFKKLDGNRIIENGYVSYATLLLFHNINKNDEILCFNCQKINLAYNEYIIVPNDPIFELMICYCECYSLCFI